MCIRVKWDLSIIQTDIHFGTLRGTAAATPSGIAGLFAWLKTGQTKQQQQNQGQFSI